MKLEKFKEFKLSINKFNSLELNKRVIMLKPFLYNPFEVDISKLNTINPYSLELNNNWEDGIYMIINPFNFKIFRKVEILNNKVIKAFMVSTISGRFVKYNPENIN